MSTDLIVETAKSQDIKIITHSRIMTPELNSMQRMVKLFRMQNKIKIIISGSPTIADVAITITAATRVQKTQKTAAVYKN